jgi:hypothetical protein
MDLEKALEVAETYSREYLLYLLSFFDDNADNSPNDIKSPQGKIVLFSLISAAIGVYLSNKYVSNTVIPYQGIAGNAATELLYWIAAGVAIYIVLLALRAKVAVIDCLSAALRVLPVGYVLGAYTAYAYHYSAYLWSSGANGGPWPYVADILAQDLVLIVYLPGSIGAIPKVTKAQKLISTTIIVLSILFVQVGVYASASHQRQMEADKARAAAAAAQHAKPKPGAKP